jgi:MFS family permease
MVLASALPQLYTVYRSQHMPRKLAYFIVVHYPGCLSLAGIGAATHYADALGHQVAVWLIVVCVAVCGLSMGMVMPLWVNLMAKVLPERARFTLWSWIMCAGTGSGLLGAWGSHRILGDEPNLAGYTWCALIGGAITLAGTQLFWWVVEPVNPEPESHETFRHFLDDHLRRAWGSRPLRRLIGSRMLSASAGCMTGAFLAVAARERFALADQEAAVFTAAAIVSMIVHGAWVGPVGDRLGNKAVMVISPCLVLTASTCALVARSPSLFIVAFGITGGLWLVDMLSYSGLVMDYCRREDKTSYIAIAGTCVAPVSAAAPLLGGLLVRAYGYEAPFAAGAMLAALAAVVSACVIEPTRPSR